jgi:glycosyltransferase involved in cell wall biosynthesis
MIWNVAKAFFTGKPLQVGYFYRCHAKTKIKKLIQDCKPDHIYCQLTRVSEYIKECNIPKTLDYQDVFSMGARRRAEQSSFFPSIVFNLEYRRMKTYENEMFDTFENKTIISVPDRDLIPHPEKDKIAVIPNGVDHSYFKPGDTLKKFDILFTGNMGYPPNIDAARFIANEIFPLVLEKFPKATLLIAGANPHVKVQSLKTNNITVSGWVPDIRESYASSRIFIAPMRIGTGLQNKLLEAMAMNLPCITSNLANQALGAKPNSEILIGDNANQYAEHIIQLLQDPGLAQSLAENGNEFVKKVYSWENSTAILENLMLNTNRKHKP